MIDPMPPIADGFGLPWEVDVDDAVAEIAHARAVYGDTFVIDSGRDRYLFTFSAEGVAAFYSLAESDASKGVADWKMLSRKIPQEVFDGRRTFPHDVFGREDAAFHLTRLDGALDEAVAELGTEGEVEVFVFTRRLGHRMGLSSWGGPGATEAAVLDHLIEAFDALDGSESFVHPDAMAAVAASEMASERAALATIADFVAEACDRIGDDVAGDSVFARIVSKWLVEPTPVRNLGIAYDVTLIHLASMSNLFAALGWLIVDLLEHPADLNRVAAADQAHAEQCALESTRLAQRSIMTRYVLRAVSLDTGACRYRIQPGVTVATLLPLTNTTAGPGLDRWDPSRWSRRRLVDPAELASPELVTVFGHGKHTCPAQPFSLAAMTKATTRLFSEFNLEKLWSERPIPVPAQIGGVARAAEPCPLRYRRRWP